MSKVTLKNVGSGYNTQANINANNDLIEAAFDNTLSRNGTSPNEMLSDLDMNGHSIQNLPDAVRPRDPVTLAQAGAIIGLTTQLTSDLVNEFLDPDDLVAKLEHCAEDGHGSTAWYKITPQEQAVNAVIVNWNELPGCFDRYGNRSGDMGQAIAYALRQNEQDGGAVVTSGPYTYNSSIAQTWCAGGQDNKTWLGRGTIINFTTNVRGLTIGPIGSDIQSMNIVMRGVKVDNALGTEVSTSEGYRIQQVYSSKIDISGSGWKWLYRLAASDSGCTYNDFYLGDCRNNYNVFGFDVTDDGWANENDHWGGRLANVYEGEWLLNLTGAANSNRWHNTSFEVPSRVSSINEGFVYMSGFGHQLINCRFEGIDTDEVDPEKIPTINQNLVVISDTARGYVIKDCYGLRSAYITGRGRGGKIIGVDEDEFTSDGGGAVLVPLMSRYQSKPNTSSITNIRLWELYQGSGNAGGVEVGTARTSGTLLNLTKLGTIVSKGSGTQNYMCLVTHVASLDDEPGVGPDWEDFWMALPSGNDTLGASAWAEGGSYTEPTSKFKVDAAGKVTLQNGPTFSSGTGTPEAAVTAPVGSVFLRTDGSTSTTLYIKTSGTGNTGWTAK